MPDLRLRAFLPADRARCLAIFDSNVPDFFDTSERDDFAAFLDELPGPYFVLDDGDGESVACGGYAFADEGRRADLCWGMVRRDRHRSGLGTRLTTARIAEALADTAVRVVALNTSQHTVDFYRALGFVVESIESDGYAPGLDRCEMRLHRDPGAS